MAQAADQHTPTEWGEDRWTLDEIFDYLTKALGYPEDRALYEMEQARLARQLVLRVEKIVDGKPQGDPEYLPFNKKHKLVRHLGWVVPQNHKWGDNRWTGYRRGVLDLWPPRPPASQTAPAQQPEEDKGDGWQVGRVKKALKEKYPPDGQPPIDLPLKTVRDDLKDIFKRQGWKLASLDSVARAIGRRDA